jgi:molybdopterin molybdotransferase
MDGFAFRFNDWQPEKPLAIAGETAAGNRNQYSLAKNTTFRIFTGAPLPQGADTVVMQEKAVIEQDKLWINDTRLTAGSNVREPGSEIKAGTIALYKNDLLTAPAIAFLAGIGIADVRIFPSPVVSIIITGNEFQATGEPLEHGQVYESNSYGLTAALNRAGVMDVLVYFASDSLEVVEISIAEAMQNSDIVLLTGGVSVGDYDFVIPALKNCGVVKHFHKVRQKPGKPLFFGTKANKLIFGLPGNPSSVLTCFYEYVLPAIYLISGRRSELNTINVPITETINKGSGLTHFLKGRFDGTAVTSLSAQESYRLKSFAKANCLIVVPEETTSYIAGEMVEIHLLPQ